MSTDREIRIKAEPLQTDPNECRFTVSETVWGGAPVFYRTQERAKGSPLPQRLFELDGIEAVHVADNVVTVSKASQADWRDLMKAIGGIIRAQLQSGEPAIIEIAAAPTGRPQSDIEIRDAVQRALDEGINPFVSTHGGAVTIEKVEDAVLYLRMSGGCQGCSAASATLRQGVQALIAEEVPEVREIIDLTDHHAGESPYM